MRVVIAGGHGKIALELERLLAASGDSATALVRNPDHFADVRAAGAEPVLCDLEAADVAAVAEHLNGADAAVFAAGAGPGSGPARKETVDKGAAALFAEAAQTAGVRRFIQISSMGIDKADDPSVSPEFAVYLRAKGAAEDDLRARDLDWTILRPGSLTNDPGTGKVTLGESVPPGSIPRADVAAVIAVLLRKQDSIRRTLEVISGDTPITDL
jgi:uncharacterized protein YbjT (DUF2867 family)